MRTTRTDLERMQFLSRNRGSEMPARGLEPPRPKGHRPSTCRVYQFHHAGCLPSHYSPDAPNCQLGSVVAPVDPSRVMPGVVVSALTIWPHSPWSRPAAESERVAVRTATLGVHSTYDTYFEANLCARNPGSVARGRQASAGEVAVLATELAVGTVGEAVQPACAQRNRHPPE